MNISLLAALATALTIYQPMVQAPPGPQNLDFEKGRIGGTPPGWFVPTQGFAGTLSKNRAKQGENCVHLRADRGRQKAPFGNIMQSFDARTFRGKVVRFRAAVRTEIAEQQGAAQMWLRVDRAGKRMGFFDNMGDRPIRDRQWRYYEIVGDVHDDAEQINLGLMINGDAQAWFDDVTFEVLGEAEQPTIEPPRPLRGRALENIVAFTRLLGYVRYFHPSDEAAEAHWNEFAIAGVRAVEVAKSPAQLAGTLASLFGSVAPTVRVFETGVAPSTHRGSTPPAAIESSRIMAWKHRGLGSGETSSMYASERISGEIRGGKIPEDMPRPDDPFAADLGGGVSCLVPLAVYADENGTNPKAAGQAKHADGAIRMRYTGDDRATRLADVALCWNVMQHFYPYFEVVDSDWSDALTKSLKAAATDKDERAFLDTLRRLIAALHDGHGNVMHASDTAYSTIPLLWDWIEGKLVVTHVPSDPAGAADTGGLKPGDVVRKIDGRSPRRALKRIEQFVSAATPSFRRHKALRRLAAGQEGDAVVLEVEDTSGNRRTATLRRTVSFGELSHPRPPVVHEIETGIFYLDFDRITDQQFTDALPKLEQARGIVFDFRGYPQGIKPNTFFPHIIDRSVDSPQWHIPAIRRPDRQDMAFERGGEWHLSPSKPYLGAKKAFITNSVCVSYAESCLGIIEHYKLGEIVGEPTAGTNGNINYFTLPGGYRVVWTGMKVLKQDGSQHHGIGIRPTIPVSRTIKGVSEGRDELLEQAVDVVSGA